MSEPSLLEQNPNSNPQADPNAAPPADPNAAPPADPNAAPPADPNSEGDYELEAPEGFELDAEITPEFKEFAKGLKIGKEDAHKLLGFAARLSAKQEAARVEAFEAQKKAWADEVRADKEIGGAKLNENLGFAAKVFDTYAPELRKLLGETGFGNHPVFVKAFVRIGKAISGDRLPGGGQQGKPDIPVEEVLYGKMNS